MEAGNPETRDLGAERLLIAVALAAVLFFVFVGIRRPVFVDEANSVILAGRGFAGVLDGLSRDTNLPLYYFLLSLWMRAFGDSEVALRLLSALFYAGGCLAVFALGMRLTRNRRAAGYAALLYVLSELAVRQAHNIRMYSMLGMLSGLSVLAFLRLFRDREGGLKSWSLFLAVNALGAFTHVWFAFVLAAQFIALAIFDRRQTPRFLAGAAASAAPFAALWGGRFIAQVQNGSTGWMPAFQPVFILTASLELLGPLAGIVLYGMAALVWAKATAGARRKAFPEGGIGLLLAVTVASLALPLLVSTVRPIYWPGRYTIIALPPLAAVLGGVFALLRPRLIVLPAMALIGIQAFGHFAMRDVAPDSPLPPGQSDRATAEFLLAHAAPGDAIVFTSLTQASAEYYFRRAGAAGRWAEYSFPADTARHLGWTDMRVTAARRPLLEQEAAALARDLQTRAARGAKAWVYDGYGGQVTPILIRQLDISLGAPRRHELQGAYHRHLLEYGPRTM